MIGVKRQRIRQERNDSVPASWMILDHLITKLNKRFTMLVVRSSKIIQFAETLLSRSCLILCRLTPII